ncbi:formin-like protein 14 [Ananas comosus]|uniref:Formin-like protein 14 n=1 Tax=Ananas comosus TaxID=4615 RepID=A0A6P5FB70_ANACO|nr:formin-like protein 14 [Ananas comosus]
MSFTLSQSSARFTFRVCKVCRARAAAKTSEKWRGNTLNEVSPWEEGAAGAQPPPPVAADGSVRREWRGAARAGANLASVHNEREQSGVENGILKPSSLSQLLISPPLKSKKFYFGEERASDCAFSVSPRLPISLSCAADLKASSHLKSLSSNHSTLNDPRSLSLRLLAAPHVINFSLRTPESPRRHIPTAIYLLPPPPPLSAPRANLYYALPSSPPPSSPPLTFSLFIPGSNSITTINSIHSGLSRLSPSHSLNSDRSSLTLPSRSSLPTPARSGALLTTTDFLGSRSLPPPMSDYPRRAPSPPPPPYHAMTLSRSRPCRRPLTPPPPPPSPSLPAPASSPLASPPAPAAASHARRATHPGRPAPHAPPRTPPAPPSPHPRGPALATTTPHRNQRERTDAATLPSPFSSPPGSKAVEERADEKGRRSGAVRGCGWRSADRGDRAVRSVRGTTSDFDEGGRVECYYYH